MDKEQLKKIHSIGYDALEKFDKFCTENNIKYFLRGGSALGAVKYSGYVPWDDDIDIALKRCDYEKLICVMPNQFGDYLFVSYKKNDHARCYFPRIILKKEIAIGAGLPCNNEHGLILIDILPIDNIPNNKIKRFLLYSANAFFRLLGSLWTLEAKDNVCKRYGVRKYLPLFLYRIKFHRLYKQESIYEILDQLYTRDGNVKTYKSGIIASSKWSREVVPSDWWGDGSRKKFRSLSVRVPEKYDLYLKRLFGKKYMTEEPSNLERTKSHF